MQLNLEQFEKANAQVLGISVDHVASHHAFAKEFGELSFPLLADFHPHGEVTRRYGLWRPDRGHGHRALFVVDRAGVIRWSRIIERGWPGVEAVLAALEAM